MWQFPVGWQQETRGKLFSFISIHPVLFAFHTQPLVCRLPYQQAREAVLFSVMMWVQCSSTHQMCGCWEKVSEAAKPWYFYDMKKKYEDKKRDTTSDERPSAVSIVGQEQIYENRAAMWRYSCRLPSKAVILCSSGASKRRVFFVLNALSQVLFPWLCLVGFWTLSQISKLKSLFVCNS